MKLKKYIAPVILMLITIICHLICIITLKPVVQILTILVYLCISVFMAHFSYKNGFYIFKFYLPYITGAMGIMLIFLILSLGENGNGILFIYLLLYLPIPLLILTVTGFLIDKRLRRR
ncbi:MAG: hypothetical protein R3Y63_13585 [Eubacteriales bacterium]